MPSKGSSKMLQDLTLFLTLHIYVAVTSLDVELGDLKDLNVGYNVSGAIALRGGRGNRWFLSDLNVRKNR